MITTDKLVRVGIVGLDHPHQYQLIESLSHHPDVQLCSLWASEPHAGKEVAARYGCQFELDAQIIVQDSTLNTLIVSLRHGESADLLIRAQREGRVVACPLPGLASVKESNTFAAAIEATNGLIIASSELRHSLPLKRAQQALRKDILGPLYSLYCARRCKADDGFLQSGVLLDLGAETLDYLAWCAGAPVTRVYAEFATLFHSDSSVEDTALVHLSFADGSMGLAEISSSLPANYPASSEIEFEVVGERGVLVASPFNQKVIIHGEGKDSTVWEDWLVPAGDSMAEELVDRLAKKPLPDETSSIRTALLLVAAARESAQTGRAVNLRHYLNE